jgi:hypothetical protein
LARTIGTWDTSGTVTLMFTDLEGSIGLVVRSAASKPSG